MTTVLSKEDAINYIINKLKLTNVVKGRNNFNVRRYNTLVRIQKLVQKDPFVANYSNSKAVINKSEHCWIDIWVGRELITIRYHKK